MDTRQSLLKQFANCPRQFYYSHVLGLGRGEVGSLTVLGSVWHYALDVYETLGGDLETALKTFNYYWSKPWELGLHIDYYHRGSDHEKLRKRGVAMLVRYDELAPYEGEVVGTELYFTVQVGKHRLSGTIDKLLAHPGLRALEVVDYKTAAFVPEKLKFSLQFTAYCLATELPEFWESIGRPEDFYKYAGWRRQGQWFHARNTRVYNAGTRNAIDYQRLVLMMDEMERAIEQNIFMPDYSGESCGFCPFTERCGTEVEDPRLGSV